MEIINNFDKYNKNTLQQASIHPSFHIIHTIQPIFSFLFLFFRSLSLSLSLSPTIISITNINPILLLLHSYTLPTTTTHISIYVYIYIHIHLYSYRYTNNTLWILQNRMSKAKLVWENGKIVDCHTKTFQTHSKHQKLETNDMWVHVGDIIGWYQCVMICNLCQSYVGEMKLCGIFQEPYQEKNDWEIELRQCFWVYYETLIWILKNENVRWTIQEPYCIFQEPYYIFQEPYRHGLKHG